MFKNDEICSKEKPDFNQRIQKDSLEHCLSVLNEDAGGCKEDGCVDGLTFANFECLM